MPEINIAPRTVSNYATVLKPAFKKDLDGYLKNRQPVAFLSEVRGHLQLANGPETGNRYNIQLINALVMYVGTSAIQYLRTKGLTPTMSAIGKKLALKKYNKFSYLYCSAVVQFHEIYLTINILIYLIRIQLVYRIKYFAFFYF